MERAEALTTLRLGGTANGAMVESAYWRLVRKAQQHAEGATAQQEIERLNLAREALAPKMMGPAPMRKAARRDESRADDAALALLEAVADWVWAEALRIRMRWPRRNPEIAIISGAAIVLMVLALRAGASLWGTFGAAGVLLTAVWAPWRAA